MKIYLLMLLIGALLTAIHFTSAPEQRFEDASAIALPLRHLSVCSGDRQRQYPLPGQNFLHAVYWASLTHH